MIDVVIIGGGPAGLALGGTLAGRGHSVVIFERTCYDTLRVGETLGAEVAPLIRELGAGPFLGSFLETQPSFVSVRSTFGSNEMVERPSITHPLGAGWHVDRTRFDHTFAAWAESQGAQLRVGTGRCVVSRTSLPDQPGYLVRPQHGEPVRGRFLVDATGRGAHVTTSLGLARWLAYDRQVAIVGHFVHLNESVPDPGLVLEATREGFWYSAPQSNGKNGAMIGVFVTDADLLVQFGRNRRQRLEQALTRTTHTARRVHGLHLSATPLVFRSESGFLTPTAGPDWYAVGDALIATDPLGGNGVARALRGTEDAVNRVEGRATGVDVVQRFGEYLEQRADYYATEKRWSDAPFWARRRFLDDDGVPASWRELPLTLMPTTNLVRAKIPIPACAEVMLPPCAIETVQNTLESGTHGTVLPAHTLLSKIREVAPLGDLRLLAGLQSLVRCGVLTTNTDNTVT